MGLFSDRRRKRSLDRDLEVTNRLDGLIRELRSIMVQPFQAGVQRAPCNTPLATVRLVNGFIDDVLHDGRDVDADPVSPQHSDDRMVADFDLPIFRLDEIPFWDLDFFELDHATPPDFIAAFATGE